MACSPFPDVVRGMENITIGYPPSALSTYIAADPMNPYSLNFDASAVNYTQLQTLTSTQGIYLSLPQDLVSLNPAFITCGGFTIAVGDPPRKLGPATAMVPQVTTVTPPQNALPGASVGPANGPWTPSPTPKEPNIKAPLQVPPVDPESSTSQNSSPQGADPTNADAERPGGSPPSQPHNGPDPGSWQNPSNDVNKAADPTAVKGSDEGVNRQDKGNGGSNLLAGAGIQPESDTASPTQGTHENADGLSVPSIDGQQVKPVSCPTA